MTETQTSTSPLEALRAELNRRGWTAQFLDEGQPVLYVANPGVARMGDKVICEGETFRWSWGQGISPVTDAADAATRIMHVLREVAG